MKNLLLTLAVAGTLGACGGGYHPGPMPQPKSPVITDPGALSVQEFTSAVTKLQVVDPNGNVLKLSLSGPDAAAFTLTQDGTLRFAIQPDYTAPADADKDNVYQVTVTADDTYSTPATVDLSVTVTACASCRVVATSEHVTTDASTFVPANIISSFEFPAQIQQDTTNYTLTGAFATTTDWNDLEYADPHWAPLSARIGNASVSTCQIGGGDCNSPTGSITIHNVTITQDTITFLMSGGNGTEPVGVQILDASQGTVLGNYTPNTCGEPVLLGDQDYAYFDVSALIGEKVDIKIYDNSSAGCGFVAFDHFYQTGTPRGTLVGVLSKPLLPTGVTLEGPVAIQQMVPQGSFENPVDMVANRGWVATGAFAAPTTDTAWQGTTRGTGPAHVGDLAIGTCEIAGPGTPCDSPTGTLTSPPFQVIDTYFNFLMHGGGTGHTGLRLLDTLGNVLATYTPSTCSPSYIANDDDWTHIDISALKTAYIQAQLFDEESNGCGFVSTDQWYQSSTAWNPSGNGKDGGAVALTATSVATLGFNVTVNADAFQQVIGDFDDATVTAQTWTATGDFANPASADAWVGTSGAAHVGARAVSTCQMNNSAKGCDASTGTLTSPLFTVDASRPYLNFLMTGGNPNGTVGLNVLDASGNVLQTYAPNSCSPSAIVGDADWVTLDLTAQAGAQVKVQMFDDEANGCGFVSFDHVYMGAVRKK